MKRSLQVIILVSAALTISCSRQTERTVMQYMPHMSNTPILKAQRGYEGLGNGASVMMPPENTIAIGHKPYRIETPEEAEAKLQNPLPKNIQVLERGKKVYGTYCYVCHGPKGLGDGPIVNPYPIPKSLQSENMLKWKDGHIFHVITKGQGVMPSYAQQISVSDRWAVIHYVRALQRAENPSEDDVRAYKKLKEEAGVQK
jgi:mono/diheme cytochrome c family protein